MGRNTEAEQLVDQAFFSQSDHQAGTTVWNMTDVGPSETEPAERGDSAAGAAGAGVEKGELPLPSEFFDADSVPLSGRFRQEHTVVPGIYFTPGVGSTPDEKATGLPDRDCGEVTPRYTDVAILSRAELVHQEREVAKNLAKLIESNKEMLEFDPDGKDVDLVEARAENDGSIARAEERLEMMRKRLEYLDPLDHTKA